MSQSTEVNAALTLPVVQAGDTTDLTEQDVILTLPGVLAKIVIIMEVATKKLMGRKQKHTKHVIAPVPARS